MLYYVSGTVAVLEPGLAVIDCGGVGYGCRITAYTAGQLKLNQNARLYVTESIREDARHAATQENFLLRVAALGVGQCAQIAENPLLGVFPDGAGVHDDHICALGAADNGVAALGEKASQSFYSLFHSCRRL